MWGFGRRKKKAKEEKKGKGGRKGEPEGRAPASAPDPLDDEVQDLAEMVEREGGSGEAAEGPGEPAALEPVNPEESQEAEGEKQEDDLLNIFAETEAEKASVYRGLRDSLPEVDVQDLRAEAMRVRAVLRMRSRG